MDLELDVYANRRASEGVDIAQTRSLRRGPPTSRELAAELELLYRQVALDPKATEVRLLEDAAPAHEREGSMLRSTLGEQGLRPGLLSRTEGLGREGASGGRRDDWWRKGGEVSPLEAEAATEGGRELGPGDQFNRYLDGADGLLSDQI